MTVQTNQQGIAQLTSTYSPTQPPQLPVSFGDYLSLLWRIDHSAEHGSREVYYRQCATAVARGLEFDEHPLERIVRAAPVGEVCAALASVPYRKSRGRLVDAHDQAEAIRQLVALRDHILTMAAYHEQWTLSWPGSRVVDVELRERLFAVFFTAYDSQFRHFSRLILVIDIVLQELLLGDRKEREVSLIRLIKTCGYPDPESASTRAQYG
ncbi:MAG: hypothetical protein JW910_19230 [Anaerolineae bacterium]|nr:hypothetical protein [Anaerolineae bacterium]